MTMSVDAVWKDEWDTTFIHRFQNNGFMLKGLVRPPVSINGNKFKFIRTKPMATQAFVKGSAIQTQDGQDDIVEMTSNAWVSPFEVYDWDGSRMPASETDARQFEQAKAIGRQADKIIMDPVKATDFSAPGQVFGNFTQAFDPTIIMSAVAKLGKNDVLNDGDLVCGVPSQAFQQLLTYQIFANSQWVGSDDLPIMRMTQTRVWQGIRCFQIPEALAKIGTNGTDYSFYLWHTSAIGAGHNDGLKTEIWREGRYMRWVFNSYIDGAATVLLPEAICELRFKGDSSIALRSGI